MKSLFLTAPEVQGEGYKHRTPTESASVGFQTFGAFTYDLTPVITNPSTTFPSLSRSVAIGAIGFGLVSLCVFATVAFGESWMYRTLGLSGAYIAWTVLFILLGGAVLGSLVVGRWRLPRFYLIFGLAFFAYAVGWIAAYFTLRGAIGEWVGSLAGSILMAVVFAAAFGAFRLILKLSLLLFVTNSVGYFFGSALNDFLTGRSGMLAWGILYGLFLGAGIGAVLHFIQRR